MRRGESLKSVEADVVVNDPGEKVADNGGAGTVSYRECRPSGLFDWAFVDRLEQGYLEETCDLRRNHRIDGSENPEVPFLATGVGLGESP
jgi:hypothetical protein